MKAYRNFSVSRAKKIFKNICRVKQKQTALFLFLHKLMRKKSNAVLEGGEHYGSQKESSKENNQKEDYEKSCSQDDQEAKVVFLFSVLSVIKHPTLYKGWDCFYDRG